MGFISYIMNWILLLWQGWMFLQNQFSLYSFIFIFCIGMIFVWVKTFFLRLPCLMRSIFRYSWCYVLTHTITHYYCMFNGFPGDVSSPLRIVQASHFHVYHSLPRLTAFLVSKFSSVESGNKRAKNTSWFHKTSSFFWFSQTGCWFFVI